MELNTKDKKHVLEQSNIGHDQFYLPSNLQILGHNKGALQGTDRKVDTISLALSVT